jgi:hypothetical protein
VSRPADEQRRTPGPEPWWADAWEVDFAADAPAGDGWVGGFVRLSLLPAQGVAWWWTSLLTPRLVAVRDHEVPLPRAGLEVRADGLWGELVCETALEHWSVGLEAFGVAYDDPSDAWGDEWGERVPVGLDLEWEATARPGERREFRPAGPWPSGTGAVGYADPGRVHGEILVGPDRIPFSGAGFRSRASGVIDWWSGRPHRRLAWVGGDGAGCVDDDGARPAAVLGDAPLQITAPARPPVRLARHLCRVEGPGGGLGWGEEWPAAVKDRRS